MQRGRCVIGKPSAPQPPDPRETSQAQTGTNVSTTIANNVMRAMDQHGPTGSLTYHVRGGGGLVPLSQYRPPAPTQTAPQRPSDPFRLSQPQPADPTPRQQIIRSLGDMGGAG